MPPPGFDEKAWKKAHEENMAEINGLWAASGCGKASPRTRTHVDGTLKKLAKERSFGWIIPLWRSTSATVHMYGSDFLFESRGYGHSALVWAQPRYRATWLSFLGASYSYLTDMLFRIKELAPEASAGHIAGQHVVSQVFLRRFAAIDSPGKGLLYPFRLSHPGARHKLFGPGWLREGSGLRQLCVSLS